MKILLFIGLALLLSAVTYLIGYIIFLAFFRRAKDIDQIEAKTLKGLRKKGFSDMADRIEKDKLWLEETDFEEVYTDSFDGLQLYGRFYENPQPCGKTVILLHGYHSFAGFDFGSICPFLFSLGLNILAVDERTHGKSEGEYITLGVAERFDAIGWAKWVEERCGEKEGVILYGASMGATTAILASSENSLGENVIGVIADSGYIGPWMQISATMKKKHIPTNPFVNILEIFCMMKGRFTFKDCTTTNAVPHAKAPILFIAGDKDEVVSFDDSRINYEQCASRSEYLLIEGAGHCKAYLIDEKKCQETIASFIDSLEGPPSPERLYRQEESEAEEASAEDYEEEFEEDYEEEYEESSDAADDIEEEAVKED